MLYILQEHLPEVSHGRWPKHVVGCTIYNAINLYICMCLGFYLIMGHQCMVMIHNKFLHSEEVVGYL